MVFDAKKRERKESEKKTIIKSTSKWSYRSNRRCSFCEGIVPRGHGHRRHNPPNTTHRKHRGNVNISQQNNRKNLKRLGHNVGNNNLICCQLHVYKETHTTHTTDIDRHTERKRERTRENERERKRKREKERCLVQITNNTH